MSTFRSAILVPLFMAVATTTFAADFPQAPPNQKEAEAQGLQRVSLEELKKFIPGIVGNKGFRGESIS
ncbi:MAG: hypothetical protein NUV63_10710 [Gallionella sp.]|nr:hypothetical protein [Gallionella sp.]